MHVEKRTTPLFNTPHSPHLLISLVPSLPVPHHSFYGLSMVQGLYNTVRISVTRSTFVGTEPGTIVQLPSIRLTEGENCPRSKLWRSKERRDRTHQAVIKVRNYIINPRINSFDSSAPAPALRCRSVEFHLPFSRKIKQSLNGFTYGAM